MICGKCKHMIYMQAFTTTECQSCGDKVVTPHMPGFALCDKCSEKENRCQQCGEVLQKIETRLMNFTIEDGTRIFMPVNSKIISVETWMDRIHLNVLVELTNGEKWNKLRVFRVFPAIRSIFESNFKYIGTVMFKEINHHVFEEKEIN